MDPLTNIDIFRRYALDYSCLVYRRRWIVQFQHTYSDIDVEVRDGLTEYGRSLRNSAFIEFYVTWESIVSK